MDREQKRQLVLLLALLVAMVGIVVALGQFYRGTAELRTLVIPSEIFTCERDDDCGLANQLGCCPCEASGGQGAVNRRKRPQLKAFLEAACSDAVPCVAVDSCRGDVRARCFHGRCRLEPTGESPADPNERN